MIKSPIIDAEFTVVGEPAPQKASPLSRFGWWCLGVLVKTVIGTLLGGAAAFAALYILGVRDDQQLRWFVIVIILTVTAGGSFLRGWFRGG